MNTARVTVLLALCASLSQAMDIYVNPKRQGEGDGTRAAPFATLEAARARAAASVGKEPVHIILMDGVYYLPETFKLSASDGGTKAHPVTYRGLNRGKAVLSGGRELAVTWKPYRDGIYVGSVSEALEIDQLFINGARQRMARFPNAVPGKNVFDCWSLSHRVRSEDPETNALAKERVARWANPKGAYLHAMHGALWGDMHWLIKGKKPNCELILEGGWQNNRPAPMHPRYRFIENVFEELDAEGEWFFNQEESQLYYYPPEDVDLETAKVEMVTLRHLVELNGSREAPVRHIHFDGLVFKHAARVFMDNKEPLLRSDWTVYRGGAVLFNGAAHCSITRCEFDQTAGNAIFVNNWNRNLEIAGCHIHDSGANGVAFVGDPKAVRSPLFRYGRQDYQGMDRTPGPASDNYPADCTVVDCVITRTGRDEKQTAPVQISMAAGITVSHCSIYDVPRAGINISEGTFGGHVIEHCDVFNTVLETGDHGSYNSWGRDRFWDPDPQRMNQEVANDPKLPMLDMVAPNILRNSRWRCDHGWDIDLDDGSSNYYIYNNVLLNGGLKLREGYDRTATNNVIVNNALHPHVWLKDSGDLFKHNIVFGKYRPAAITRGLAPDDRWGREVDCNLFTTSHEDRLAYAVNGCDEHSIVADPLFVDPASGDFRVMPDSPALELGFVNFDMDRFGVTSPELRAIAKRPVIPAVKIRPNTAPFEPERGDVAFWKGAQVRVPKKDELSAFGVRFESRGVALAYVGRKTEAHSLGFRSGDFVQQVGDRRISSIADLQAAGNAGETVIFKLIRDQSPFEMDVSP